MPVLFKVFSKSPNSIPPERYLVVPGNHNLEWGGGSARFNNFIAFCEKHRFMGHFTKNHPESIYVNILCWQNKAAPKLALLGLNSCLEINDGTSSKNANILKSYCAKVIEGWDDLFKKVPKVMICHHPLHKISMAEGNSLTDLNTRNVRLALAGDIHTALPKIDSIKDIKCISAGALFASKAERGDAARQFNMFIQFN